MTPRRPLNRVGLICRHQFPVVVNLEHEWGWDGIRVAAEGHKFVGCDFIRGSAGCQCGVFRLICQFVKLNAISEGVTKVQCLVLL